ncbi:MAG: ABC transporter permease [Clostridiales bacterium]|nr:ABC transporter permease [Clostridiales bacterium]
MAHIRRAAGKSALAVLLAVLLCGVVGQLALMKQSYARLCADTVITANFIGGLPLTVVPQIKNSDCVRDSYYEVRETVELNSIETSLVFTNNITRYTGEEADITYADGYDASVLNKNGKTVIIGKTLTKILGLEPGDTVTVNPRGLLDRMQSQYISTYRQAHSNKDITDVEILALYQDEIARQINSITRTYTIAGVFTTPSGAYDVMAFTPGDYEAGTVVGKIIKLDVAEFTLADNKLVDEFRSFCEKMAGGKTSGVTFVMDTSKLEHLRNTQRLLETLYPIAVTAALLIGDFLCCLVIVQSSKEAAIMRIQGTTKGKTRSVLALEQVLLSIAGLIVGSAALLAYKGSGLSVVSPQLGLFAALYFAVILISAVTCSSLATRRNVLELLQTKE